MLASPQEAPRCDPPPALSRSGCRSPRSRSRSRWPDDDTGDDDATADDDDTTADDDDATADDDDDDTADDDDTGDDDSAGDPWDDPGFWTASSDLDFLLDLGTAPPMIHWELWMYRSPTFWGSDPDHTVIAHSYSSLDLLITDDGVLLLGGVALQELEGLDDYHYDHLYGISSPDLENWGTHLFPVLDAEHPRMTDAALERLPDGTIRAVYYSTPLDAQGDPTLIPGDHPIKVAYRDGNSFVEHPDAVYADEWLVDPTTCHWDGTYHYFSTYSTEMTHATGADELTYVKDEAFQWGGNQVPYCLEHLGELWIVAQGGGGMPPPGYKILQPDGSFSDYEQLWTDLENLERGGCTSPVMGIFQGEYVLFCAVAVDGAGHPVPELAELLRGDDLRWR